MTAPGCWKLTLYAAVPLFSTKLELDTFHACALLPSFHSPPAFGGSIGSPTDVDTVVSCILLLAGITGIGQHVDDEYCGSKENGWVEGSLSVSTTM
jgi:hypothetical protein